jgi:hypothetical protein
VLVNLGCVGFKEVNTLFFLVQGPAGILQLDWSRPDLQQSTAYRILRSMHVCAQGGQEPQPVRKCFA